MCSIIYICILLLGCRCWYFQLQSFDLGFKQCWWSSATTYWRRKLNLCNIKCTLVWNIASILFNIFYSKNVKKVNKNLYFNIGIKTIIVDYYRPLKKIQDGKHITLNVNNMWQACWPNTTTILFSCKMPDNNLHWSPATLVRQLKALIVYLLGYISSVKNAGQNAALFVRQFL